MTHFRFFLLSLIIFIGSSYIGYKYNDYFTNPKEGVQRTPKTIGSYKEIINIYKDYTK